MKLQPVSGRPGYSGLWWSLLMLITPAAWALDCQWQRGFIGTEASSKSNGSSEWNNSRHGFGASQSVNGYLSTKAGCDIQPGISATLQAGAEYARQFSRLGEFEGARQQGLLVVNQGYLSWAMRDDLALDIGKIRRSSGYLLAISPLDVLRNPVSSMRNVQVNPSGARWRNFYDEGSLGLSASLFRDEGTYELLALPQLTHGRNPRRSAADWKMLERTNASDRYSLSYTSGGFDRFNPTVVLLAGQTPALALGGSSALNDKIIFNIEGALTQGQKWRHLNGQVAQQLQSQQPVDNLFQQNSQHMGAELGVGLRYAGQYETEYGIEYYAQSQGYSRAEWRTMFDTAKWVNGGYQPHIPPEWLTPELREGYRQYARWMAAEVDNSGRYGYLQGKHYLSAWISRQNSGILRPSITLSGLMNLVDGSNMMTLQVNSYLTEALEGYVGTRAALGSTRSEFGFFGEKGVFYMGLRMVW
ncbi:hypothetical protein [Winslowiella iniecta]|uniref:Uncharacterized protein n=1 Tax=Winslowiella iniecta TaxID=1560201 RepID=A0A0L7T146_9GAMM|nr:hypothetical protein [Winslowiella iniecta]KOC89169.1 hypothetical protein NG42_13765 [Winslowiella iniecta]KOC93012.1 hypothetical protein NG43_12605 [Winslowiella iniecta]